MTPRGEELGTRISELSGCELRPERDDDQGFLGELYASTRSEELAATGWSDAQMHAFLAAQFRQQHTYYHQAYRDAEFLVIVDLGEPIGRLYLSCSDREIRIMDIALLPHCRGRGIGSRLIDAVMRCADDSRRDVTLHVEPFNRALRLYERFGFRLIEPRGVYLFLGWSGDRPPLITAG